MPSRLSPQWLCGNSCTWAHDVWSCHKAIVVITRRAYCFHDNIYYAHLAFVRFEHSVCRRSLMTIICMYVCLRFFIFITIFHVFVIIFRTSISHIPRLMSFSTISNMSVSVKRFNFTFVFFKVAYHVNHSTERK